MYRLSFHPCNLFFYETDVFWSVEFPPVCIMLTVSPTCGLACSYDLFVSCILVSESRSLIRYKNFFVRLYHRWCVFFTVDISSHCCTLLRSGHSLRLKLQSNILILSFFFYELKHFIRRNQPLSTTCLFLGVARIGKTG